MASPRVAPVAIAGGRLGPIFHALHGNTGTVCPVEVVDAGIDAMAVAFALQEDLEQWGGKIDHPNVFSYSSVRVVGGSFVHLEATRSIDRHLHSELKDFGRLHPFIVCSYLLQIVRGLDHLHQCGIFVGGVSLASLYVRQQQVQIGGWFPTPRCLQVIHSQTGQLSCNPYLQSSIRRDLLERESASHTRDLRSLAYIMVEMLTGTRVRGRMLDDEYILHVVAEKPLERSFILQLLEPTTSVQALLFHPYLGISNSTSSLYEHEELQNRLRRGQSELIRDLMESELVKRWDEQRRYAREIRAWLAQFEKRYQRKPLADERPSGIQKLQARCRTTHERIQELERRLRVIHDSLLHGAHTDEEEPEDDAIVEVSPTAPRATFGVPEIDTESMPTVASDARRRSPAQNAFLHQLSTASREAISSKPADTPSAVSREHALA